MLLCDSGSIRVCLESYYGCHEGNESDEGHEGQEESYEKGTIQKAAAPAAPKVMQK